MDSPMAWTHVLTPHHVPHPAAPRMALAAPVLDHSPLLPPCLRTLFGTPSQKPYLLALQPSCPYCGQTDGTCQPPSPSCLAPAVTKWLTQHSSLESPCAGNEQTSQVLSTLLPGASPGWQQATNPEEQGAHAALPDPALALRAPAPPARH